jgi:hypothetical protein
VSIRVVHHRLIDVLDPEDLNDPGQEKVGRAPAFGLALEP